MAKETACLFLHSCDDEFEIELTLKYNNKKKNTLDSEHDLAGWISPVRVAQDALHQWK